MMEWKFMHKFGLPIALIAYALIALFTFGYSYNQPKTRAFSDPIGRGIIALPAAFLWPLYWSQELQSTPTEASHE